MTNTATHRPFSHILVNRDASAWSNGLVQLAIAACIIALLAYMVTAMLSGRLCVLATLACWICMWHQPPAGDSGIDRKAQRSVVVMYDGE